MYGMEILKPVVALAGWTMVVWLWMYATRIPAMTALPNLITMLGLLCNARNPIT